MRYHSVRSTVAWLALLATLAALAADLFQPAQDVVTHEITLDVRSRTSQAPFKADKAALARHIAALYRQPLHDVVRIVDAAFETGARLGLPPGLLLAIVAQESSFRATARSSYGALGLMQVVPRFHQDKIQRLAPRAGDLLRPEANLEVGARVLYEYWLRTGDLAAALKRYSGGATRYAQKVFSHWTQFENVRAQPDPALSFAAS